MVKKKSSLKVIEFKGWPQQLSEGQREVCLAQIDDIKKDIELGKIIGFAYVSLSSSGHGTFTGWIGEINNDLHRAIGGVNLLLKRLIDEALAYSKPSDEEENEDDS